MARSTTDPEVHIGGERLPGEPVTIDQAANTNFAQGGPIPAAGTPTTLPVQNRLEAYRTRERKTTQLARALARVFTNDELAQLFDSIPDGHGEPGQLLADALGKAWGDTRPGAVASTE